MKLTIRYQATYRYEEKVSLSPHLVRVFPRQDLFLRTEKTNFSTDETADVQYRQDLFGNLIAYCFFPQAIKCFDFRLDLDVLTEEKNPFHFLLDAHALNVPFAYQPREGRVLAPFLDHDASVALPSALRPDKSSPTVETLCTMLRWMHENIAYERRNEGEAHSPEELLRLGRGSCRDFAVCFAQILRQHGIATRLASGFLWEPEEMKANERRAQGALHAWVEAYLPGAGWVGLDPTNGIFCNHFFITTAVGLHSADIAPVSGHYYGKKTIKSELTTALEVTKD